MDNNEVFISLCTSYHKCLYFACKLWLSAFIDENEEGLNSEVEKWTSVLFTIKPSDRYSLVINIWEGAIPSWVKFDLVEKKL